MSAGLRRAVTAFLVVLLVAALALVGYQLAVVRPDLQRLEARQADRAAAVSAAERFVVLFNTYDATTMDDYRDEMAKVLTAEAKADFEEAVAQIAASVEQVDMKSQGQVLTSAVATADGDSARVLVVADADVDASYGKRARHFRWEVDLQKVQGSWLVDDFTAVT